MSVSSYDERRKHKRFRVREDSSFVVSQGQTAAMGKIIDISEGGFSFCCSSALEWSIESLSQCMLFGDHDSCLSGLPLVHVSDRPIEGKPHGGCSMRRTCVKFGELAENQKFLLDCFIWVNSSSDA